MAVTMPALPTLCRVWSLMSGAVRAFARAAVGSLEWSTIRLETAAPAASGFGDGLRRQRRRQQYRHRRGNGHCKLAAALQKATSVLLSFEE